MNATETVSDKDLDLLRPILIGGALAGILDVIPAFIAFGITAPQGVAAGLLGRSIAFQGGAATWILGILLHFIIAFVAAALYCAVARKLTFMVNHWLVCGISYGIAVFLFMNLIVVPLSALHVVGPYELRGLIQGILGNMLEIGLPISFSMRMYCKEPSTLRVDSPEYAVPRMRSSLIRPVLVGGLAVGTLDKISGFVSFGFRSPQGIAAGLLSRSVAFQGGMATWILGMILHYLIALIAATVYCLASRRLGFLRDHWLLCGPLYGIAVFLVMTLIVLPLSALHLAGPYALRGLVQGIVIHMLLVGLPISFSLYNFAREGR